MGEAIAQMAKEMKARESLLTRTITGLRQTIQDQVLEIDAIKLARGNRHLPRYPLVSQYFFIF